MLLAIGISNLLMTVGFYHSATDKNVAVVSCIKDMTIDDFAIKLQSVSALYGENSIVENAIIASVVPSVTDMVAASVRYLYKVEPLIIGPGIKTGLDIRINDPSELGADLVCMAAGAIAKYSLPVLLVNMGDTLTISYVDINKRYTGTVIYAGMGNVLKTLVDNADLLKPVSLTAPQKILGADTTDSIKSGVLFGTSFVVDGFINRIKSEYMCKSIIATGEFAPIVTPHCSNKMLLDKALFTDGLYHIFERQRRL
mgnify:CR=1 FL=1